MHHFLLVYLGLFWIVLTATYLSTRNHESVSRKLAKIRVRIDDSHRRHPEPPDEEFENNNFIDWLVLMSLLFLLMLFGALS